MSGHRDVRPGRAGEFHGGTGIPYEFDSLAGQTAWNAKTDEYGYMVPGDSTSETKARRVLHGDMTPLPESIRLSTVRSADGELELSRRHGENAPSAKRAARTQSGRPVVANSGYNEDTGVKTARTRKEHRPKHAAADRAAAKRGK